MFLCVQVGLPFLTEAPELILDLLVRPSHPCPQPNLRLLYRFFPGQLGRSELILWFELIVILTPTCAPLPRSIPDQLVV